MRVKDAVAAAAAAAAVVVAVRVVRLVNMNLVVVKVIVLPLQRMHQFYSDTCTTIARCHVIAKVLN